MKYKFIYPFIALGLGLCVYWLPFQFPSSCASYFSLAVLASMDTICGAIRASFEGKFDDDVFFSGFICNTIIAAFLAFLGDQIGLNLFFAALIALGGRLFLNLSIIRRQIMDELKIRRQRNIVIQE